MTEEDFICLIEASDDLERMDRALGQITGMGHSGGLFINLDKIYEVLLHHSHPYYRGNEGNETEALFYRILLDMDKTPAERAKILLNGTVRY